MPKGASRRARPRRRYKKKAYRPKKKFTRKFKRSGGAGYAGDKMIYKGIGIADTFFTKLRYVENISLTSGLGTEYKTYQYAGNDLYDPNITGTGVQPEYFDQICGANTLYKRYVVMASKVSIRCCSQSDSFAGGNVDIALTSSQQPYASTGWTSIDDQLGYKTTHSKSVTRYDNAGVKWLTNFGKTKKVIDIKDIKDNLIQLGAYYNASPTTIWYWIIGSQGMDRTSTSASVNLRVTVTYYVMFYTENEPARS